jgi:hypothetical protein
MMKRYIWIVEIDQGVWVPTSGSGFTREQGQYVLSQWRQCNPNDRFRLVKYVPAKSN